MVVCEKAVLRAGGPGVGLRLDFLDLDFVFMAAGLVAGLSVARDTPSTAMSLLSAFSGIGETRLSAMSDLKGSFFGKSGTPPSSGAVSYPSCSDSGQVSSV